MVKGGTQLRLKNDLILREVVGQHVIVPIGRCVQEVTSIVYISASAAYLWDYMKNNEFEIEDLVKMIVEHYNGVSEETARKDIQAYIKLLLDNHIIDDGRVRGRNLVHAPKQ